MRTNKRWLVNVFLMMLILGIATIASADTKDNLDYDQEASWSIFTKTPNKLIDVFFAHPTTYGSDKLGLNAPINDKDIMAETDSTVNSQASVFKNSCNIFAPRYRQVSFKVLAMPEKEAEVYLSKAEKDLLDSFKYYLKKLNNGRPFIIAGHSQGSNLMLRILIKNPNLINKNQLVAAYLIGWSFTKEDLKKINIPLAVKPEQTGGLITWNTIGKGGKSPTLLPGASCINPLSWTDTKKNQPASLNNEAVIELTDGTLAKIKNFTSAQINDQGGLQIPTPKIIDKLNMNLGKGVYHRYDYEFFLGNLLSNVDLRCGVWLKKK